MSEPVRDVNPQADHLDSTTYSKEDTVGNAVWEFKQGFWQINKPLFLPAVFYT